MLNIRAQYQTLGPQAFYEESGGTYRNPHEAAVRACLRECIDTWALDIADVLDLACGSGEVSLEILAAGGRALGIDPYTWRAYEARTGLSAERQTFQDIAQHGLGDRHFTMACCSYALHLVEPSWLPSLLFQIGRVAPVLLVLSPHKRPDLTGFAGIEKTCDMYLHRVRATLYNLRAQD